MRTLLPIAVLVVGVFAIISVTTKLPGDSLQLEFALTWTQRAFGTLIAVAAGMMVLVRAAQQEPLEKLVPLTLAALVGVLILSSNWGVAVAIGAIVAALVASGRFGRVN